LTMEAQSAYLTDMESTRFRAAVREGVAEADSGELVEDDEVLLWLEQQEHACNPAADEQ